MTSWGLIEHEGWEKAWRAGSSCARPERVSEPAPRGLSSEALGPSQTWDEAQEVPACRSGLGRSWGALRMAGSPGRAATGL